MIIPAHVRSRVVEAQFGKDNTIVINMLFPQSVAAGALVRLRRRRQSETAIIEVRLAPGTNCAIIARVIEK